LLDRVKPYGVKTLRDTLSGRVYDEDTGRRLFTRETLNALKLFINHK